jgi:hypothetical protein
MTTSCRPCHRTFLLGFPRFGECVFLVTEYWDVVLERKCWFSMTTWPLFVCVFSVACVCERESLWHGVHRQTNRHSREISEVVPARTHARTRMQRSLAHPWAAAVTSDAESLSLLIHTSCDIHRHTRMHVCLFFFLSMPDCWSPDSLFLLDTGGLVWKGTSCRPCQPAFLPGFHRFSECVCFSWLSYEIVCWSESVDFLSLLDMYLSLFLQWLVCVCVCVTVCTGRQTDTVERE